MTSTTRNRTTAVALALVVAGMLTLSAAAVPLYDVFCRMTGFGGTPVRATAAAPAASDTTVTVLFNADVDPALPWAFVPAQRRMDVRLGEQSLAFYHAVNEGEEPIVGRAVFNVTPYKVGGYFAKLACFCFEEQTLEPGQAVDMPVSFFIDPAMLDDRFTTEVRQITLSYTFFESEAATTALRARRAARPTS